MPLHPLAQIQYLRSMNLSYWEIKSWLSDVDYTIVGSGIVGLNAAIALKEKHPKAKVLVLERGILPQGASTKNAGFACFGSLSEILDDLQHHTEEEVVALIEKRWKGLQYLRSLLGDQAIDYQAHGGYELFTKEDQLLYEQCLAEMSTINRLLHPLFQREVFSVQDNLFGFQQLQPKLLWNALEGQLDTGKMMQALLQKAHEKEILIVNGVSVLSYTETVNTVEVETDQFSFQSKQLLMATNGFASQLNIEATQPARAQVLITKPIANLEIKGTFHLDRGYYYFRNIDNRILLGGGRNLDFKGEETTELAQTTLIQQELERLLKETILPRKEVDIETRWSGIMGVGSQKKPVLKQLSDRVYCGVRLGGMGVAIGSLVGRELAELANQ